MSDWKEESNKRRDVRQSKDLDADISMSPSKKDTKRWCKGKLGKEHKLECRNYWDVKLAAAGKKPATSFCSRWKILLCTVCGKELKTYYGEKDVPDWVVK